MGNFHDTAILLKRTAAQRRFLQDVLEGLSASAKHLPCKYFYDERGSHLFEQICQLDEYYPTRTELAIMRDGVGAMARRIGPQASLVELGSGSSSKTRRLLDHLQDPVVYVPVDISRKHLKQVAKRLAAEYPQIEVIPVHADFTRPFELPSPFRKPQRTVVYFPGSTIGNFLPEQAVGLLAQVAEIVGHDGGLLIGIDLHKETSVIEAAYNDREGVTAQFNLNLLHRINEELGGDFVLDAFTHEAIYNVAQGRVEISLVSDCAQQVQVAGRTFEFAAGEKISTEYSHKYQIEDFAELASRAGLALRDSWTDARAYFGVLYFEVEE